MTEIPKFLKNPTFLTAGGGFVAQALASTFWGVIFALVALAVVAVLVSQEVKA